MPLKKCHLFPTVISTGFPQMFISQVGHFPTARSTLDKPFFDQEGLIHFFQGTGIFADSSSNRRQAHRSSLKFFNNGEQDFIAKSRTLRSNALAIRGVPRLREAISIAA